MQLLFHGAESFLGEPHKHCAKRQTSPDGKVSHSVSIVEELCGRPFACKCIDVGGGIVIDFNGTFFFLDTLSFVFVLPGVSSAQVLLGVRVQSSSTHTQAAGGTRSGAGSTAVGTEDPCHRTRKESYLAAAANCAAQLCMLRSVCSLLPFSSSSSSSPRPLRLGVHSLSARHGDVDPLCLFCYLGTCACQLLLVVCQNLFF